MRVQVNGTDKEICNGMTLGALVDSLQINRSQMAVELNLRLIPREQVDEHELTEGDRIEIVTLVGGG